MKQRIFILTLILCFAITDVVKGEQNHESHKRVLLIYSYSPDFPTFTHVIDVFNKRFSEAGIRMDTELLYSKAYQSKEYFNIFAQTFSYRFSRDNYDLIVVSDDNALDFALERYEDYFKGLPVIFLGINDKEKAAQAGKRPGVTGVAESTCMKETIELAQKLNPGLKEIIAISDEASSGQSDLEKFYELQMNDSLKRSHLDFSAYNLTGFIDTLKQIDGNRAFLLLSAYHTKSGEHFRFYESLHKLTQYNKIPIYHLWHHGFGQGITGGVFISHTSMSKIAADMALKILEGESPADFPVVMDPPSKVYIDYEQVKHFNLREDVMQDEWTVINEPERDLKIPREYFYAMLVFLLVLAFAITMLLANNVKQRKIRRLLKERKNHYQSLFEMNFISMMLLNPDDGKVVQANQAACGFYGYTTEEMKRLYLSDFNLKTREENQKLVARTLNGIQKIFASRHQLRNGEMREVNVYTQKFTIEDKDYLYASILDVTQQRNYERELLAAKKQAEESDKLKSAFLSNLSHEIRTPLNAIVGFSDLLNKREVTREQFEKYTSLIFSASDDLTATIGNIIDIALIESGQLQLNYAQFSVNKLLKTLYQSYMNSSRKQDALAGIHFSVAYLSTDVLISADEKRVMQVLQNLLDNAVKFTQEGEINFGAEQNDPGQVLFYVKDTGVGIPPEKHRLIFEPFRKEELEVSDLPSGTGLGLTISQQLVELHKGKIWLDSDKFAGSVFYVQLPLEL